MSTQILLRSRMLISDMSACHKCLKTCLFDNIDCFRVKHSEAFSGNFRFLHVPWEDH